MSETASDYTADIQTRFEVLAQNLGRVLDIGDEALIDEAEVEYREFLKANAGLIENLQRIE